MKKILKLTLIISLIPNILFAREQVRGVGSSTVFPFVTAAAEEFGSNGSFKTPVIESTGTGGGFKLFCAGIGSKYPDISNASRPIKKSEKDLCAKNGINQIKEVQIGYDGIVLAAEKSVPQGSFTIKQVYLALAKYVPYNGKIVENPYQRWSDIDKSLPNKAIYVYGPPPTSGTRDAFVELVLHKACMKHPLFLAQYPNKKKRKSQCSSIREDGAYVNSGENDNMIVHKLKANKSSYGIFGYSFLENNSQAVTGSKIAGYNPTFENISAQKYPISRSLFVYVKEQHYEIVKSLKPFIEELMSDEAIGDDGYLLDKGLIPLSPEELAKIRS